MNLKRKIHELRRSYGDSYGEIWVIDIGVFPF